MRALLTGASGFIGGHVLDALLEAGAQVRCLVRESSPRRNLEDKPVEIATGDLRDAASLERATKGCDAVYHCAADYRFFASDSRELYDSNVELTQNPIIVT